MAELNKRALVSALADLNVNDCQDVVKRLVAVVGLKGKATSKRDSAQRKLDEAQIEYELIDAELRVVVSELSKKNPFVGNVIQKFFEV